jgi:hypothetical protein
VGFGAPSSGIGGIIHHDQLLFSISGKSSKSGKAGKDD